MKATARWLELQGHAPQSKSTIFDEEFTGQVIGRLPILQGLKLALAAVLRPRTRGWGRARAAIAEYVQEQEERRRSALNPGDGT
jgi:heterodisulfide reductase subunit C